MTQGTLKIGEVAKRTGLSPRTLRYYESLGLLTPPERMSGGQRAYSSADLTRLYRICLLRQLGTPLAEIRSHLDRDDDTLAGSVDRHLAALDDRMTSMGRLRERVERLAQVLRSEARMPDEDLVEILGEMREDDAGVRRRLSLLVYDDLVAAHDFLVQVFGFGPGPLDIVDGVAHHGVVIAGDGVIWLHPASDRSKLASPQSLGASTHAMAVFVDDVDAHYARVVAAGIEVETPPRDMDYGVREYDVRDLEGGLWSFMTELPGEELPDTEPGEPSQR